MAVAFLRSAGLAYLFLTAAVLVFVRFIALAAAMVFFVLVHDVLCLIVINQAGVFPWHGPALHRW